MRVGTQTGDETLGTIPIKINMSKMIDVRIVYRQIIEKACHAFFFFFFFACKLYGIAILEILIY